MKLELDRVTKTYRGGVRALDEVSLVVTDGVLGLLGPNGAGKSTLLRILATVTTPTGGLVLWNGADVVAAPNLLRPTLGYLPQDFGVYPHLDAVEFLTYLAAARGLGGAAARTRIRALLDLVNMSEAAKRPLGTLSGGMKQRVGIAQALLNDPRLLIVDEPTAGLDPEERAGFRQLLAELAGDRIVILSSHIVSDIEATATAIAIVHRGRLVRHETPERLLRELAGRVWEAVVPSDQLPALKERFLISNTVRTDRGVRARFVHPERPVADAEPSIATLEEAYLSILAEAKHGAVRAG